MYVWYVLVWVVFFHGLVTSTWKSWITADTAWSKTERVYLCALCVLCCFHFKYTTLINFERCDMLSCFVFRKQPQHKFQARCFMFVVSLLSLANERYWETTVQQNVASNYNAHVQLYFPGSSLRPASLTGNL